MLLNGAGFAGTPPSSDAAFAVFAAVGSFDFNYSELSGLDEKLEQTGFPHVLRHFDGPHEWAPVEVMDEALAWFQLIAMKQNREPRDDSFVLQQEAAVVARAKALEQTGQSYEAWREYRQAIATFGGLTDTASLQQSAATLAQQKAVRDGAKREKQEFQEQIKLTSEIYSGLAALRGGDGGGSQDSQPNHQTAGQPSRNAPSAAPGYVVSRPEIRQQTEEQIIVLRQHAAAEKNPDKLRVYRRALAGVFVAAGESGDESLNAKNFALAKDYFQLATVAEPDSAGALKELATAQALSGDRKGAYETLRRAREKSKDLAAFSVWLNEEPAFVKLHGDPQFRALLANP